jgi:N-acetylneuraminate synthase/N,N'-diacetyllegionaminate synthase
MDKISIIAEAGVNHNGDLEKALLLIETAAHAGADYVKFQTFCSEELVSASADLADYQKRNMGDSVSQLEMLKKLEIPLEWYPQLIQHCHDLGIKFLSTGFDRDSVQFLLQFNPDFIKIPSGEVTNFDFLQFVGSCGKRVVLSTGMSTMEEVKAAVRVLIESGMSISDLVILHCHTEYPTEFSDVNLLAMRAIADELGVEVGYSDHTNGIEVSIAAVALGAVLIEKHFTLDKGLEGPDHKASLDPNELNQLVTSIRNVSAAISGTGVKEPTAVERKNILIARRSLFAKRNLSSGDIVSKEDLTALRPGSGISPMSWNRVVGKKCKRNIQVGEMLNFDDFE